MFLTILVFFVISFVFFVFGFFLIKTVSSCTKRYIRVDYFNTVLFGMISLSVFLRSWYFFFKINVFLLVFLLIISFIGILIYRNEIFKIIGNFLVYGLSDKFFTLVIIITTFYIAYKTSLIANHYDVGLYHINLIRWIENYKIVPGLANLHSRFGFMGNWHIFSAFFGFSPLFKETLHVLNGWVIWFFMLFCLKGIFFKTDKTSNLVLFSKLFFSIFFLFSIPSNIFRWYVSSPITDFPITVFSFLLLILSINYINKKNISDIEKTNLVLLPVFMLTIKLSSLPLLLLSFMFFTKLNFLNKKIKSLTVMLAISIFSLFFLSNVTITGYLVYPIPQLGIKFLDWVVPVKIVAEEKDWIKSWAIDPWVDKEIVFKRDIIDNILIWFNSISKNDMKILISIYILFVLLIIKLIIKQNNNLYLNNSFLFKIILVYIVGLSFWFFTAPDFRFGYGYIISILMLLTYYQVKDKISLLRDSDLIINLFKLVFILAIANVFFITDFHVNKKVLITPDGYSNFETKEVLIEKNTFYVPKNNEYGKDQTGYNGFPGTPEIIKGFSLRGSSIENGFRIK